VLLEAMAMGAVTVAGNNSGYASVMQDTGAISLVNPRDSLEFSRRLALLMTDETLRAVWREWAKSYIAQYNWPQIVDQYEQLYQEALASHGRN